MYSIMTRNRLPVKRNRVSQRPATPFGQGVLSPWTGSWGFIPDPDDSAWVAQSFNSDSPDGAELDRIAAERTWEMAYESSLAMGDRCGTCGLTECNGACTRATVASEPADPDNGGVCDLCAKWSDYRDRTGLCPVCENLACDATIAGQNERAGLGYRVF
jgi:hypothetical protein